MFWFLGNAYNQEERVVCAGYDNGDIKLFDLRNMSLRWETNIKNGVMYLWILFSFSEHVFTHLWTILQKQEFLWWHSELIIWLVSVEARVLSLAQRSGLRIQHCCGCGCRSKLQLIRPLAWELPYVEGMAEKEKKNNQRKATLITHLSTTHLLIVLILWGL